MTSNNHHDKDLYEVFIQNKPAEAEKVRKLIQEGRNLYQAGNLAEARNRFIKALAVYPYIPSALVNLASISIMNNNLDQAWYYISTGIEFFSDKPAVHAVAVEYWKKRQSDPYIQYHCLMAVSTLKQLMEKGTPDHDPSIIERSRRIVYSTLIRAANDMGIVRSFELFPQSEWDEYAIVTAGIAYFNLGEFSKARLLWQQANNECSGASSLYLYLLELIDTKTVIPFKMDYDLKAQLPVADDLQYISIEIKEDEPRLRLITNVNEEEDRIITENKAEEKESSFKLVLPKELPSLAIISGLQSIFEGEAKKGELALCILFFQRWPHLPEILHEIIEWQVLPNSLRLNAAFYLLSVEGPAACQNALEYIENKEELNHFEQFMASVIGLQLAIYEGKAEAARERLYQARSLSFSLSDRSWNHFLDQLEEQVNQIDNNPVAKSDSHRAPRSSVNTDNVISLIPRLMRKQDTDDR
jgi:tetratricopeptide (TPR) repeat protein